MESKPFTYPLDALHLVNYILFGITENKQTELYKPDGKIYVKRKLIPKQIDRYVYLTLLDYYKNEGKFIVNPNAFLCDDGGPSIRGLSYEIEENNGSLCEYVVWTPTTHDKPHFEDVKMKTLDDILSKLDRMGDYKMSKRLFGDLGSSAWYKALKRNKDFLKDEFLDPDEIKEEATKKGGDVISEEEIEEMLDERASKIAKMETDYEEMTKDEFFEKYHQLNPYGEIPLDIESYSDPEEFFEDYRKAMGLPDTESAQFHYAEDLIFGLSVSYAYDSMKSFKKNFKYANLSVPMAERLIGMYRKALHMQVDSYAYWLLREYIHPTEKSDFDIGEE